MSNITYTPTTPPAATSFTVETLDGIGFKLSWKNPAELINYNGLRISNGTTSVDVVGLGGFYIWKDTPTIPVTRTFTHRSLDRNSRALGTVSGNFGPYTTPSPLQTSGVPGQIVQVQSTTNARWDNPTISTDYTVGVLNIPGNGRSWLFRATAYLTGNTGFNPATTVGTSQANQVQIRWNCWVKNLTTAQYATGAGATANAINYTMHQKVRESNNGFFWTDGSPTLTAEFLVDTTDGQDYQLLVGWQWTTSSGSGSGCTKVEVEKYSLTAQEVL